MVSQYHQRDCWLVRKKQPTVGRVALWKNMALQRKRKMRILSLTHPLHGGTNEAWYMDIINGGAETSSLAAHPPS